MYPPHKNSVCSRARWQNEGLRLSQGLDEALEDWDELGAEESNDDSDGGESEIERRAEESRRLMPY